MDTRRSFDIVCPNNHNQTVTFSRDEFEKVLESGALLFHCNTCDTDWTPTGEQVANIRKGFDRDTAALRD